MEHDPRFPLRPDTPEFDLMSKLICQIDEDEIEDHLSKNELDALIYMLTQRLLRAKAILGNGGSAKALMAALYMDAFVLGMNYGERRGEIKRDKPRKTG